MDMTRSAAWLMVAVAVVLYAVLFRGFLASVDDAKRRISEDPSNKGVVVLTFVRKWSVPSALTGASVVVAVALFVGVSSLFGLALAAVLGAAFGPVDFAMRARVFWLTPGAVARWESRQDNR